MILLTQSAYDAEAADSAAQQSGKPVVHSNAWPYQPY